MNRVEGVRYEGVSLPNNLVVQTVGPGHLIAASGYTRVIETKGGELLSEGFDPFRSTWLSRRFVPFRQSLLSQLPTVDDDTDAPEMCESFVRDVGQSVVRRVLRLVRNRRHGGMLIFLPDESHDGETLANWLRFRVQFKSDDSALLYRRLMLRLMARAMEVGRTNRLSKVTWNEYQRLQDTRLNQINGELVEFSHLVADMMSVDGSLVLDHSFRLIGFGGEILGDSPVYMIHRAFDLEANRSNAEPADTAGTRHRSAYRLVNGLQKAIAVVISQDGDVRFVAHHNDKLTYWPYLP